jgi:hypothetical protein
VKVAQLDKIINFPTELDLPWGFIRQRYGITSLGGNLISNFHCNMDHARGKVAYAINESMPEPIPSAEYYFTYAFTEPERKVCCISDIFNITSNQTNRLCQSIII